MFNNIYQGKKVLVTGHTGFKGAWLSLWLTKLGANVIGYSLAPPTNPNLFDISHLKNKIKHILGDVRDLAHLEKVFRQSKPEVVFHLAAQAIVKESYKNPRETFETNVMGTISVLEAARKAGKIRAIINITSDKCYANKNWAYPYRENDHLGGSDPYSASKGCSELITSSYRQSFLDKIGLASVRAGNIIGGGDWADDRLVPDCIKALIHKKPIILRCPHSIRPWQYILEPLSGYLWLGSLLLKEPSKYSQAWNFGPKDEEVLSVGQVTKQIIRTWGSGSFKIKKEKFYEPDLLKLDISKAKHILRWYPVYDVHQAIEKTVNWYKEYYLGKTKNMMDYSLGEIEEYEKQAKMRHLVWSKK